jgi:hypothetical protein
MACSETTGANNGNRRNSEKITENIKDNCHQPEGTIV